MPYSPSILYRLWSGRSYISTYRLHLPGFGRVGRVLTMPGHKPNTTNYSSWSSKDSFKTIILRAALDVLHALIPMSSSDLTKSTVPPWLLTAITFLVLPLWRRGRNARAARINPIAFTSNYKQMIQSWKISWEGSYLTVWRNSLSRNASSPSLLHISLTSPNVSASQYLQVDYTPPVVLPLITAPL